MKQLLLSLAMLAVFMAACAPAAAEDTPRPKGMRCSDGPMRRTYGMSPWNVYGCDDHATLIIMAAPGNAASPFYFVLTPTEGGYQLRGKGKAKKNLTDPVYNDLRALTRLDIQDLLEQTQKHHHE